jgi:hypothetical protein
MITINNNNSNDCIDSDDEGFNEDQSSCGQISLNSSPDIPIEQLAIKGPNGSIRGKKNSVRNSILNYKQLVKQAVNEKSFS